MPEDLIFPFDFDETGDAGHVDGEEFYYQHAQLLGLIAADDQKGRGLTKRDQIELRDIILSLMEESPYFDEPITMTIMDSDQTEFVAEVDVPNTSTFEIIV